MLSLKQNIILNLLNETEEATEKVKSMVATGDQTKDTLSGKHFNFWAIDIWFIPRTTPMLITRYNNFRKNTKIKDKQMPKFNMYKK